MSGPAAGGPFRVVDASGVLVGSFEFTEAAQRAAREGCDVGGGPAAAGAERGVRADVAAVVAAVGNIERLFGSGDCPLADWRALMYRKRCKAVVTELRSMTDRWLAAAGAPPPGTP